MKEIEKESNTDWPAIVFIFVALPLAFTYGGMWIGISVLVAGIILLGWKKTKANLDSES